MIHRVVWRLTSDEALDFWAERLSAHGYESSRTEIPLGATPAQPALVFADFEGLEHELRVVQTTDPPLIANHPDIPSELALQGFHAVRAFSYDPGRSRPLLEDTLGFEPQENSSWESRGESRGGFYVYDDPPPERPLQGAGTVHHVAWAAHYDDEEAWQQRVAQSGNARPTPIIDRHYFRSVYFREPSGVLFEIASMGPGFTVDEPLEQLGEKLSLTPQYEHLRPQIEPHLTPLRNPREQWARR